MTAWRVLGIGSPFGDDRLGWWVVECLQQLVRFQSLADCSAQALDRPGTGLIHALSGARGVIVVDAVQARGEPGRIHRLSLEELQSAFRPPSSHSTGVAEALALAKQLDALPPELLIYGVEIMVGDGITVESVSKEISPAVAAAIPVLCTNILSELELWSQAHSAVLSGERISCA